MKRILLALLAVTMVAAAGCSANETPKEAASGESGQTQAADEAAQTPGDEAGGEGSDEGNVLQGETVFGKVKNIVGNEIELELGKPPFDLGEGDGADGAGGAAAVSVSQAVSVSSGSEDGVDSSEGDGGESAPYISYAGADGNVTVVDGSGGEGGMDLEYTGESQNIIVPTGSSIKNMAGDAKLENIKKGSVLMVTYNEEGDTATASDIMIMG